MVSAHPDGVDVGASDTVAPWTAAGTEASCCVCASGEVSTEPAATCSPHAHSEPWPAPELWLVDSPAGLQDHTVDVGQRTVTALRPDGWRRRSKW